MKHTLITSAILASSLTFSNISSANDEIPTAKQWSVGVGTYELIIDSDGSEADDFSGFTLSSTYAFNDNVLIKGQYYSLEHDDFSEIEITGFDFAAFYGTGLASEGFKAYVGLGLYSESLEVGSLDEDFSGAMLSGGFGYNWESVSLDLSVGIRSTGDYEDLAGDDTTAVSSSLVVAYRF